MTVQASKFDDQTARIVTRIRQVRKVDSQLFCGYAVLTNNA
jgi:hypothetical protein